MADKKEPKVVAEDKKDDPIKPGTHPRLKKALQAAEKLGATLTAIENTKGPVVIIAGVAITPIATGLKPNGSGGDLYTYEGKEFYIPHQVLHNPHTNSSVRDEEPWGRVSNYQGPEMSLFAFGDEGDPTYLLMDEHSTFTRDGNTYYSGVKGGKLLMINSASHNDQVLGNSALVNVETDNCILNRSAVIVNSAVVGRERGWGPSGPFKQGSKRTKYSEVRLKKCDIVDSELSRGKYASCNLTKSSISGTGTWENDVTNTHLNESRVQGGNIQIHGLTGDTLDISAKGEMTIQGVRQLSNQTWHLPSIYVTNKFAFTEIDYITRMDRGIKMVRISKDEIELNMGMWSEGVKLPLTAQRYEIETAIRDALRDEKREKKEPAPVETPFGYRPFPLPISPFNPQKPGESIRNQMENYITEQVVSRLGMILMLDEVENTAKDLGTTVHGQYINFLE